MGVQSNTAENFNFNEMKQLLFIFISILPFFTMAQTSGNFPENAEITVEKTGVNTVASDFGPEFVGNELWFSAFSDEAIARLNRGRSKNVFYNLYFVPLDVNGHIQGNKTLQISDISAGYHAGPVSFC